MPCGKVCLIQRRIVMEESFFHRKCNETKYKFLLPNYVMFNLKSCPAIIKGMTDKKCCLSTQPKSV